MTDYIAIAEACGAIVSYSLPTKKGDRSLPHVHMSESQLAAFAARIAQAAPEDEPAGAPVPIGEVISSTSPDGIEGLQVVKWSKDAPPIKPGMKLYAIAPSPDREDALRYRQLREHHHINDAGDGWLFFRFGCGEEYGTMSKTQREAALDAAVDAARQAPKEPTQHLGDEGILDGTNRTTGGWIGQP